MGVPSTKESCEVRQTKQDLGRGEGLHRKWDSGGQQERVHTGEGTKKALRVQEALGEARQRGSQETTGP